MKLLSLSIIDSAAAKLNWLVIPESCSAYFVRNFQNNASIVKARYGANNINDFKDTTTAVNAFYNANAGFGKDTSKITTLAAFRITS